MKSPKLTIERILHCVNGQPLSFMQLCRQTGFNYRTVRKSLDLIELLQDENNKLEIERNGFRVMIRRPKMLLK